MMLTVAYFAHKNNWGADIKFIWGRVARAGLELAIVIAFPLLIWAAVLAGANPPLATGVAMLALFAADWKWKFEAVLPIMTPVLLIGGMTTGIFTPTEGAVAASIWALFLGLFWYRTLSFKMLIKVSMETIETTATVLFIVAAASIFGWLLTATRVTDIVTRWVLGFTHSPWVFLLLVNLLLLLFVGCFLEPTAAILIAIPVLMPAVQQLGIDPVHFGLIVVLNLMIGLLHPPMGMVLFVLARVARMSLERTTMAILPWLVPLLGSLISSPTSRSSRCGCPGFSIAEGLVATIRTVEVLQVDLAPKVKRTDAIQAFVTQETPIVRIRCDDGATGVGYTYTIGTGGSSVVALLRDHLAPKLIGRDPDCIEAIWKDLFFLTHATAVGAITSLALAADRHRAVGPALQGGRTCRYGKRPAARSRRFPVYTTEGGWLHLPTQSLVAQTLEAKAQGFRGAKLKVGKPHLAEDVARLAAVREAVGAEFEIMVDANQCFNVSEAIRRARAFEPFALAWLEEPLPAEDLAGHVELAAHTAIPIAVGESIYHPSHFREYLERDACSIVQVDCARIGGVTPWLKVAHLAETFNVAICPHFLMELHVSLTAAAPNAVWVEYIPQLDDITTSRLAIADGFAVAPSTAGLGIDWTSQPSTSAPWRGRR
jgi:L-alanine-DL-glutamate epimerase-like enolase superfamily enzyme/TRAP-type C4-dicarboxylate transport system permease large subunit